MTGLVCNWCDAEVERATQDGIDIGPCPNWDERHDRLQAAFDRNRAERERLNAASHEGFDWLDPPMPENTPPAERPAILLNTANPAGAWIAAAQTRHDAERVFLADCITYGLRARKTLAAFAEYKDVLAAEDAAQDVVFPPYHPSQED